MYSFQEGETVDVDDKRLLEEEECSMVHFSGTTFIRRRNIRKLCYSLCNSSCYSNNSWHNLSEVLENNRLAARQLKEIGEKLGIVFNDQRDNNKLLDHTDEGRKGTNTVNS
ncbi:hypothetical protein VNO78_05112 [Psophocarpus tetragonolobus]|uniref:Uncharacterized protein n=1 Tax=Psophocarpus tetragonolobus TaxID=3891 RepID=A0AAN9XQP6_PSOTE